ncbi:hypothetical protein, partial [Streptomyces sp. NPDC003832]
THRKGRSLMARIETSAVKLEVSFEELNVIKRALDLVKNYGLHSDEDTARSLLADLQRAPQ